MTMRAFRAVLCDVATELTFGQRVFAAVVHLAATGRLSGADGGF